MFPAIYVTIIGGVGIIPLLDLADTAAATPLFLDVGSSVELQIQPDAQVFLSNHDTATVRRHVQRPILRVTGRRHGHLRLKTESSDGHQTVWEISVIPSDVYHRYDTIRRLLANVPGITVSVASNKVVVDGRLSKRSDQLRLAALLTDYPDLLNMVQMSPESGPILFIDLKLIELRSQALRKIGLHLTPQVEGSALTSIDGGKAATKFVLKADQLLALDALFSNGYAKILANPRLSVRSGETGRFLAGGEIPIPLVAERTAHVEWRSYGVIFDVTPTLAVDQTISLDLMIEISTLDRANANQGVPGLLSRRIDTHSAVANGGTLVLGGLLTHDSSKDVQKLPGLGQLPILGELFKSRAFTTNQSELIVFATPTLQPDDQTSFLRDFDERASTFDNGLTGRLND